MGVLAVAGRRVVAGRRRRHRRGGDDHRGQAGQRPRRLQQAHRGAQQQHPGHQDGSDLQRHAPSTNDTVAAAGVGAHRQPGGPAHHPRHEQRRVHRHHGAQDPPAGPDQHGRGQQDLQPGGDDEPGALDRGLAEVGGAMVAWMSPAPSSRAARTSGAPVADRTAGSAGCAPTATSTAGGGAGGSSRSVMSSPWKPGPHPAQPHSAGRPLRCQDMCISSCGQRQGAVVPDRGTGAGGHGREHVVAPGGAPAEGGARHRDERALDQREAVVVPAVVEAVAPPPRGRPGPRDRRPRGPSRGPAYRAAPGRSPGGRPRRGPAAPGSRSASRPRPRRSLRAGTAGCRGGSRRGPVRSVPAGPASRRRRRRGPPAAPPRQRLPAGRRTGRRTCRWPGPGCRPAAPRWLGRPGRGTRGRPAWGRTSGPVEAGQVHQRVPGLVRLQPATWSPCRAGARSSRRRVKPAPSRLVAWYQQAGARTATVGASSA